MDEKENINKNSLGGDWVKTISDVPLSDLKVKANLFSKSPYAVPENPPEIIIGEVLGSGPITDILGEGGFARVYKIHDKKLDMARAVKVLLPTGKKEVSDRFLTEARITARLNHPNIVNVYRVDEWKGCPFIEMEYIEGKSLETLLKERGKFPPYAACAVGMAIAVALKYSHALDFTLSEKQYKGVIHRDLKPANIMLRNEGSLKLMDFGIARPISTGLHTMGDNIVGTLQYLAPEQLNHKEVDQRTDIYAVGAILYEMLCGIKAFPDEGLTDLVNKKANGIYKAFQEFPLSVPKKLVEIVDNCLKVDKEERYLDAGTLLDTLNAAYMQFASEQPESALKNFMEDPGYIPVRNTVKEKKSVPPKRNLRTKSTEKPLKPAIKLPKISLPSFPAIRMPAIPKVQVPEIKFQKLNEISLKGINGIKDGFKALFRYIGHACNFLFDMALHALSSIRHIPQQASGIILGGLGGIVVIGCILFFVMNHTKGFTSGSKKGVKDTLVSQPLVDLAGADVTTEKTYIPEIMLPDADEVVKSETLTVVWHSMAKTDKYVLQIDTNGQFTDSMFLKTIAADTFCAITDLEPATYHFRVGVSGYDDIKWSDERVVKYSPVYHTPRLVAPGDTSKNCEVTFRWRKLRKTQSYQIAVAADSNFQKIVFESTGCRDTFTTHIFLDTIKTFYWHVLADTGDNWSKTRSFVINDTNDYCMEASDALHKSNLYDAERLLQKIPLSGYCKDTLAIRLSEYYLQNQSYETAEKLLAAIALDDMMAYYLKSQILIKEENYPGALNLLETAINSKTVFTASDDSSNVFYLRAKVAQMVYEDQKNRKNGKNAYYAWESVYKKYSSDQSNERYKEALVKTNQLYHTDKVFDPEPDTTKIDTLKVDTTKIPTKSKKNRWWQKAK
jgi:serine/threonine protein kinase